MVRDLRALHDLIVRQHDVAIAQVVAARKVQHTFDTGAHHLHPFQIFSGSDLFRLDLPDESVGIADLLHHVFGSDRNQLHFRGRASELLQKSRVRAGDNNLLGLREGRAGTRKYKDQTDASSPSREICAFYRSGRVDYCVTRARPLATEVNSSPAASFSLTELRGERSLAKQVQARSRRSGIRDPRHHPSDACRPQIPRQRTPQSDRKSSAIHASKSGRLTCPANVDGRVREDKFGLLQRADRFDFGALHGPVEMIPEILFHDLDESVNLLRLGGLRPDDSAGSKISARAKEGKMMPALQFAIQRRRNGKYLVHRFIAGVRVPASAIPDDVRCGRRRYRRRQALRRWR